MTFYELVTLNGCPVHMSQDNSYEERRSSEEIGEARRDAYARRAREKTISRLNAIAEGVEAELLPLDPSRPYGLPVGMNEDRKNVWNLILEHVNNFESIVNLREVCMMFKELLHSKFIAAMVPQIVGVHFIQVGIGWQEGRNDWLKTLADLRIVSKVSKMSVDRIINTSVLGKDGTDWFSMRDPHYLIREETAILRLGVSGTEKQRLQRTLELLKSGVVFPLGAVIIDEVAGNEVGLDSAILWDMFQTLFEKIGNKITSFLYRTKEDSLQTYANLRRWVALMPNLQDLIVDLRGPVLLNQWMLGEEAGDEMYHEQFPTCPSLKRYAEGPKGFGVTFLKEILRRNTTVQEVVLGSPQPGERMVVDEVLRDRELQLTMFHSTFMEAFLLSAALSWKQRLTTLNLWDEECKFKFDGQKNGKIPSYVLLDQISKFKDLERLIVSAPYMRYGGGYLNLPKLKQVTWGVFPCFKSLYFLEPAEALQYLDLDLTKCADIQRKDDALEFVARWKIVRSALYPALERIRTRTRKDGPFVTIWSKGSVQ